MLKLDDVQLSCDALFAEGQVVELRALEIIGSNGFKYNAGGWFNDTKKLCQAAIRIAEKGASGCYVTINPCRQELIARTDNQIVERIRETTADRDIIRRHWIPFDFDPVRPSGISSTNEEIVAARDLAVSVSKWLEAEMGFGSHLVAHSGNGVHLLYRIDTPCTPEWKETIRLCLKAVSEKFSTPDVKVDTSLFNESRILKLWGTPTRKGANAADRPHRMSRLWTSTLFANYEVTDHDPLKAVAALASKESAVTRKKKAASEATGGAKEFLFDLDAWIQRNNIVVKRTEPFDGEGKRYILECCVFNPEHTRTSAAFGRSPVGHIFYKCQHDSCQGKGWREARLAVEVPGAEGEQPSGSAKPWDLACQFVDEHYVDDTTGRIVIRRHRKIFYVYDRAARCYRQISDDRVKMEITRWLGELRIKNTTKLINDVLGSVQAISTVPESLEMPFRTTIDLTTKSATARTETFRWITFQNGILDLDAALAGQPLVGCLMSHTPEWFSSVSLPFPFPTDEIESRCDRWEEFLQEIFEGDQGRIGLLQEAFGYCFHDNNRLEKYFILQGLGGNGKSTVLNILHAMIGHENASCLSLESISDPVMRADMMGKMANICGDMPEPKMLDEGILKRIVSGEQINARLLYKGGISFQSRVKLFFSTNPMPRFEDTTRGIWRRTIVIPFRKTFDEEQANVNLSSELMREMSGITYWAMQGALRLCRNGMFSRSRTCEQTLFECKAMCFPILTFLEQCTQNSGSIIARDLWNAYRKWSRSMGLTRPKPLAPFVRDAVAFWPNIIAPRIQSAIAGGASLANISLRLGWEEDLGEVNHNDSVI